MPLDTSNLEPRKAREDSVEADSIEVGSTDLAWGSAWQIPVLLFGLGLLVVGLYMALPRINPPEYEKSLATIDVKIQANELEEAEADLEALGEDERFVRDGKHQLMGHFWRLYGDLRFRQLDDRVWQGITTPVGKDNLRQIVNYYQDADRLKHDMSVPVLRRYAQALATLGEDQAALRVVDRMPKTSAAERQEIVKSLIDRRRKLDPDPASETIARLLERFEKEVAADPDPVHQRRQRIWAMELRGRRLLQAADPDAVTKMLVQGGLQRLLRQGATDRELAPLKVLLGEAMTDQGEFENARIQLRSAQQHVPKGSPLNPRILLAMAEIELAREDAPGRDEQAYQLFRQAYDADTMGPTAIEALTGLGLTQSRLPGRFGDGVEHFNLAIERLIAEQVPHWDPRRDTLQNYLQERADSEYALGNYLNALDLLSAMRKLQKPNITPQLHLSFAMAFEKLGNQSLEQAKALVPEPDQLAQDPHVQARRIHHQDAANYFKLAGDAYYARATQLTHMTDVHGEALWAAAEAYDKAQLWDQAAAVYADYLAMRGDRARREEALFRLGQAHLAADMPTAAIERFEELVNQSETGQWAHESYVPLARAYQLNDQWDKAERLLKWITQGHPALGPTSPYFRDALIELGSLYYRRGQQNPAFYSRAIEVLGEEGGALARYCRPDQNNEIARKYGPRLRYMLADSLRLSAAGLLERAKDSRSADDRIAAQSERTRYLQLAQMYYNQVLTELDARHPASLEPIERVYHRNAYFYQADSAFARGDYANSILLYQDAAQRWQNHPASLVAWVQIINAASEMGDYARARAAHRQANELFDRLPPEVFDHPEALMTRQRWDDWLRWSTQLDLYATNGQGTAGVETE